METTPRAKPVKVCLCFKLFSENSQTLTVSSTEPVITYSFVSSSFDLIESLKSKQTEQNVNKHVFAKFELVKNMNHLESSLWSSCSISSFFFLMQLHAQVQIESSWAFSVWWIFPNCKRLGYVYKKRKTSIV